MKSREISPKMSDASVEMTAQHSQHNVKNSDDESEVEEVAYLGGETKQEWEEEVMLLKNALTSECQT